MKSNGADFEFEKEEPPISLSLETKDVLTGAM